MNWRAILRKLFLWFGFSIGLMVFPIILSVIMYKILRVPVSISLYTKEILFISVTLTASSLGDIYNLTRKGVKDLFTSGMLVLLVLMSLLCISLYMIVCVCSVIHWEIDLLRVSKVTIILGLINFLISGSCQFVLANVEGSGK